jgi:hypothetical protein
MDINVETAMLLCALHSLTLIAMGIHFGCISSPLCSVKAVQTVKLTTRSKKSELSPLMSAVQFTERERERDNTTHPFNCSPSCISK